MRVPPWAPALTGLLLLTGGIGWTQYYVTYLYPSQADNVGQCGGRLLCRSVSVAGPYVQLPAEIGEAVAVVGGIVLALGLLWTILTHQSGEPDPA